MLHDAWVMVDVLYGFVEWIGNFGVYLFEEFIIYIFWVLELMRCKRYFVEGFPSVFGVYVFRDHAGCLFYVGVLVDIRIWVWLYFMVVE